MKQALTEALAADNRNFLVHTDYDGSWEFSDDAELIFAAARLVERLLPGECEHGETKEHGAFRPGVPGSSWMCPGRVWDEGIVEAVAKALWDGKDWETMTDSIKATYRAKARAVLSALVELLTEKSEPPKDPWDYDP